MALSKAKLKRWGPKALRGLSDQIEKEINERSPIPGLGIYINETPSGRQISTHPSAGAQSQENAAASDPDISFFLSNASVTEGDPPETSNKVFVADGKINGEFPSGMGSSEYILDLADPSDSIIYAGVTFDPFYPGSTFDPATLSITSRFLGVSTAADFPQSRAEHSNGFIYWQLGFTFFDTDDSFRVINTRLGDINFQLLYANVNGAPVVLPVDCASGGYIDLSSGP